MKLTSLFTILCLVSSASAQVKKPNVLLICIDDLRPELPSFGKDYIHAPAIEKLASEARLFKRHYVQSPTCGSSRFALLTGIYPKTNKQLSNQAIATHDHSTQLSFPALLRKNGYRTVSLGKVSHYPGGHMGENWADQSKPEIPNAWDSNPDTSGLWKTPQGQMHGTADGQARVRGKTPGIEAKQASYPDDPTVEAFKREINQLAKQDKPWLLAVGLLRPHLPFACPKKYLDLYDGKIIPEIPANTKPADGEFWHRSAECLRNYHHESDPRKDPAYAKKIIRHYAACVSYSDANVATILAALKQSGQADNTIIVLWGDHGWHLGEQKIWGKHSPYAVALHAPLIIKIPGQLRAGAASEQVVETIDIYPTLCDLTGIKKPSHLDGKSLLPIINDPAAKSDGIALAYWKDQKSVITGFEHQIINRKSAQTVQKYDLKADPHETNNLIHH